MTDMVESIPAWTGAQAAVGRALSPKKVASVANRERIKVPDGHEASSQVEADFNYTKDVAPRLTEAYFYDSEKSHGIHEPGDDPQKVKVINGWGRVHEFTVDRNGFSLQHFHTSHDAWEDEEKVKDSFYPEVVDFVKKTTGARRVLVFDHTIRTKANQDKKITQETNTSQRSPVTLVHCDYTAESGPLRVKQLLPDEADDLLSRRVAFFNVWKPIRNRVEEYPLAMCDAATAPSSDFFKLYLRYRDRDGENYVMKYNPKHDWIYFPGMEVDQSILLKTYDSDTDRARFVGHTAFIDPTSTPDALTRESVEIRTIAFF